MKMKKRGTEVGVVAVVKSLSSRGLAMRGHDDKFGSTHSVFEQFKEIMGEKVKKTIFNEIKNANVHQLNDFAIFG
ncbi:zinc finger MYM-type protein 1-like [Aphis craccivora]|uniref:Zinc finger MYM-type protein 1-like n=1 Tax=Aphis craccivora TaxID=307492 RepID=A0A6G0VWZ1_APHCR|nr:zinc finger MYM-type protein 1-like [Aphis craccivora]